MPCCSIFAARAKAGLKAVMHYSSAEIFWTRRVLVQPSECCVCWPVAQRGLSWTVFLCLAGCRPPCYGEDEEDKEASVVNAPPQPDHRRVSVRAGRADDHRGRRYQGQRYGAR